MTRKKRRKHTGKIAAAYAVDLDGTDIDRERRLARELRRSQWWKRQTAKAVCHWCGRHAAAGELTMDHIVPIARGGRSVKGNIVPCCKECNNAKKQLLPMEWETYLKRARHNPPDEDSTD